MQVSQYDIQKTLKKKSGGATPRSHLMARRHERERPCGVRFVPKVVHLPRLAAVAGTLHPDFWSRHNRVSWTGGKHWTRLF